MMREGLSSFFFGVGTGLGMEMLFASKSGQRTRELLKAKADEGQEYLKRSSSELRDNAGDLINRGKEAVSRQKNTVADAVEAGKQAHHEKVEQSASSPGPTAS